MKERKKKNGSWQIILTLLALYAMITLLPACVYGAAKEKGKQPKAPSAPASSQASSGQPASGPEKDTQAENRAANSSAAAQSRLPNFLEGLPLPNTASSPLPETDDRFTLYDHATGETVEVPGRELLSAALACEMDLFSPEEALKAQAVACYTLFCRKRSEGEAIACDSAQWQVWTTEAHMKERWGEDCGNYMGILNSAVDQVYGQLLQWDGEPALTPYFAISGGITETAGNVWEEDLPYLQAVASPGDLFCDGYLSTASFTAEEFRDAALSFFTEDPPDLSGPEEAWLTEVEYTPSGYVSSALLGGKAVTGTELRNAFSLRSACFTVEKTETGFSFTVRGWGHGVGMSQAGAAFLAKRGTDYTEILAHYYPGTKLQKGNAEQ